MLLCTTCRLIRILVAGSPGFVGNRDAEKAVVEKRHRKQDVVLCMQAAA